MGKLYRAHKKIESNIKIVVSKKLFRDLLGYVMLGFQLSILEV